MGDGYKEKSGNEEIRARARVANVRKYEKRDGIGHVERKTGEDVVMRMRKWVDAEIGDDRN